MSTITKEWLQKAISQHENMRDEIPFGLDEDGSNTLAALRIALASLEAEPVAYIRSAHNPDGFCFADGIHPTHRHQRLPLSTLQDGCYWKVTPLYTATPAPVSVPDELSREEYKRRFMEDDNFNDTFRGGWNACRDAVLQGADNEQQRKASIHDALCEKYNVESLEAFVEWQRNHIAELEAAPPAPVGVGETAVMPDYPGYALTQRECYQAGKKAGLSDAATTTCKLPFEQWLSQQTGTIDVECGCVMTEVFFHWLRVAYEAGNSTVIPECSCHACRPVTFTDSRFVVCPECGNKRCPHANDHRNACTGSNEAGQEGSAYPAAPQQEV